MTFFKPIQTLNPKEEKLNNTYKTLFTIIFFGLSLLNFGASNAQEAKPQTPKGPFPYQAIEVTIPSSTVGIDLGGELIIPEGKGPFPALLLLNVAGPNDRDMSFLGHKSFLVLADHLARSGFITLRLDDRGTGASGGDLLSVSYATLSEDAQKAIVFLKGRTEVISAKIGILGISEGGGLAIKALANSPDVAFAVLLSAPGLKGKDALFSQFETTLNLMGLDEAQKKEAHQLFAEFSNIVETNPKTPEVRDNLISFLSGRGRFMVPPYSFMPTTPEGQADLLLGPWYQSQWNFNPFPDLNMIQKPVLAIGGGKDLVLPPSQHLKSIENILTGNGHKDLTVLLFPGLNHIMQTANTGSPIEYATLPETISPKVLEAISSWLRNRY